MKEVLVIIPYSHIYPAMNGGMQRCINILHQLAKYFKVSAIINQDSETFSKSVLEYPAMVHVDVYSTMHLNSPLPSTLARIINALKYRWLKKSLFATTDSNFLLYYPIITSLFKHKKFDVVVLENLDSLNAVNIIRKYDPQVTIIYDAHNVDTVLATAAFQKGETSIEMLNRIRMAEENIFKKADAVMACSDADLQVLREMNGGQLKGTVVPNGVNTGSGLFNENVHNEQSCSLLFCGTLWSVANLEGLNWFYDMVWPMLLYEFPAIELIVLGSGDPPDSLALMKADSRVVFSGSVPDVKPWYNKATVAIVPLLTGSGTRLKILEAMGLGIPVVSSSIGVEGIDCTNQKDIVIADSAEAFAAGIKTLLLNKIKRQELAHNASKLVEAKYDWAVVGAQLAAFINTSI